jgi:hypothetical protein
VTRTLGGFAPGTNIRVRRWNSKGGTRIGDVGRYGVVRRIARTRVVVDLDPNGTYDAETRHVDPSCLRRW